MQLSARVSPCLLSGKTVSQTRVCGLDLALFGEDDVTWPQFSGLARDLHRLRIGGATTCNFLGNDRTEGYRRSDGGAHPLRVCVAQGEEEE